jgi:hypothetical protein
MTDCGMLVSWLGILRHFAKSIFYCKTLGTGKLVCGIKDLSILSKWICFNGRLGLLDA